MVRNGDMQKPKRTEKVVRSLRNGQLTIPAEFRRALGIEEDTLLSVSLGNGNLTITPVRARPAPSGSPWLLALYELFAPVRDEARAYSEDEIDVAIDAAVRAVRSKTR